MLGHHGKYRLQIVLFPDHRRPGFRPFQHQPLHRSGWSRRLRGDLRRLERCAVATGVVVAGDVRGFQSGQGQREWLRIGTQRDDRGGVQGTCHRGKRSLVSMETTVDDDGVEHEDVRDFQSPEGRLPLRPVDTAARWKTTRARQASGLQYQGNVIVDRGGFILSRG